MNISNLIKWQALRHGRWFDIKASSTPLTIVAGCTTEDLFGTITDPSCDISAELERQGAERDRAELERLQKKVKS
jgi:hypothetical protein